MEELLRDCMFIGLQSKGFSLDFEAEADIAGGYECYIFSNHRQVAIITGENSASNRRGGEPMMVYRQYCCGFGDDEYLREILSSEDILGNPTLLNGEYGDLFMTIINKVKSYGTRNAELLIRDVRTTDSSRENQISSKPSRNGNVIHLFKPSPTPSGSSHGPSHIRVQNSNR